MTNKARYQLAKTLPLKQRVNPYNVLILAYTASTGKYLKPLTTCGSCITDFENYKPFKEWINGVV